mgnify:CR=1 FL=1
MASALNSPVCFSALYFMNLRGEVLMERQYRDDVTRQMAAAFKTEIVNGKDRGNVPVVNLGSCTFMYKREQNVYIVAVTRAKALLVVVGNPLAMYDDPSWRELLRS